MTIAQLITALEALPIEELQGEVNFALHTYDQGYKCMVNSGKSTFVKRGFETNIYRYGGNGGIRFDLHLPEGYRISKRKDVV
jgi:hypothetical protein